MTATNPTPAGPRPLKTAPATEPMTLAFEVQVTAVEQIGPNFRRVTFGGYSLRNFGVNGSTLDLRIKLMIPSLGEDGTSLPLPEFRMEEAGWYREWLAMDPQTRGSMRTYTVRQERLDAVYPELDVDFVLHDLNLAARYADHIIAMKNGQIVAEGAARAVITEELVREVFGLESRVLPDPVSGAPLIIPLGRHHADFPQTSTLELAL